MAKRYRNKIIRFKGNSDHPASVSFIGGEHPYLRIGTKYLFLGWVDSPRDIRRLRQCCDEYLEAHETRKGKS